MLALTCYLCGSTDIIKRYSINKFDVVQCRRCSLTFTAMTNYDAVPCHNVEYYQFEHWSKVYSDAGKRLSERYQRILQMIKTFKKDGKLLDVGCSIGLFLRTARDAGFESYGIEPVESAAAFAKNELEQNVTVGTFDQVKYPDHFFDVICMFDVLEHIPDPLSSLIKITGILKEDGLLLIQCPNIDSTMAAATKQYWRWLLVPQHLYHFSPQSLIVLLHKAKFNVLDWSSYDDEQEYADNLLESFIRSHVSWKPLQKILLAARHIILPFFRIYVRRHIGNQQATGGVMLMFASPQTSNLFKGSTDA